MTVQCAGADAGLAGNVVERRLGAVLCKGEPGHLEDALAIPLRIRARLTLRRCWRGLLFRHTSVSQKYSATGGTLLLSYKRRQSPL